MGAIFSIFSFINGLNNKDHPTKLHTKEIQYISTGTNIDITREGGIKRRNGHSALTTGSINAHSLHGFKDRYALYVEGSELRAFDVILGTEHIIRSDMDANRKVSFAYIDDNVTLFTNGRQRGGIVGDAVGVPYPSYEDDPATDSGGQRAPFPNVDMHMFHNGVLYGASVNGKFLYASEPYKINQYDQLKGFIPLQGTARWIASVSNGLVIGGTDGIVSLQGSSVEDFRVKRLSNVNSLQCSKYSTMETLDSNGRSTVHSGIFAQCDDGIFFINDDFDMDKRTKNLDIDWRAIKSSAFGCFDNYYIFTGVS